MFKKLLLLILLLVCVSSLHAQTRAYVTGINTNTVSVIDTSTNTVTATIPVGSGPAGVVVSSDGTTAYVSNSNDGTVSVIDTASNTVTATINAGIGYPAISPDGKTLYVPNGGSGLVVIDTASQSITTTVTVGNGALAAIATPDGSQVYVNTTVGVFIIATSNNTVVASIPAAHQGILFQPTLAVAPDGSHVYSAPLGNAVNVISTASNTQVATIPVPNQSGGLAITPDGSRGYIAEGLSTNTVGIIDTATNTLEATSIPAGVFPFAVAVTPDGAFVYVTNFGTSVSTVSVISTATNTVVATVPVGSVPFGIAIGNLNAPFASFPAPTPGNAVNSKRIALSGSLSLGANSQGLDFAHQPMTLTVGGLTLLFPAGSVTQVSSSPQQFVFNGKINGLKVGFTMTGTSPNFTYSFSIKGQNVAAVGPNPVTVTLAIGNNSGSSTTNF